MLYDKTHLLLRICGKWVRDRFGMGRFKGRGCVIITENNDKHNMQVIFKI